MLNDGVGSSPNCPNCLRRPPATRVAGEQDPPRRRRIMLVGFSEGYDHTPALLLPQTEPLSLLLFLVYFRCLLTERSLNLVGKRTSRVPSHVGSFIHSRWLVGPGATTGQAREQGRRASRGGNRRRLRCIRPAAPSGPGVASSRRVRSHTLPTHNTTTHMQHRQARSIQQRTHTHLTRQSRDGAHTHTHI